MKALLLVSSGALLSLGSFGGGVVAATLFYNAEPERQLMQADAEPAWTLEPVRVSRAASGQEVAAAPLQPAPAAPADATAAAPERTGPASASPDPARTAAAPAGSSTAGGDVDMTLTSSVAASPADAQEQFGPDAAGAQKQAALAAHQDWCADRYRSYRPRDNSYTPYSGGRRSCVSPYSEALFDDADGISPPPGEEDSYTEASQGGLDGLMEYASAEAQAAEADYVVVEDAGAYADAGFDGYLTDEHVRSCFARYRSYRPEDNSYQPWGGGPRRQCE